MVWITPRKRSSKSHSTMMSKYKDLEQSDYFRLQQRKSAPKKNKPGAWFRIATLGTYPFYEVAYGETEDGIRNNEWNYIKTVEGEKRGELQRMTPPLRTEWIVRHFSTLVPAHARTVNDHETDSENEGEYSKRTGSYSGSSATLSQPAHPLSPINVQSVYVPSQPPSSPQRAPSGPVEVYHQRSGSFGGGILSPSGNGSLNNSSIGSSNVVVLSSSSSSNNNNNSSNINNHSNGNNINITTTHLGVVNGGGGGRSDAGGTPHGRKSVKTVAETPRVNSKHKKAAKSMLPLAIGVAAVAANTMLDFWLWRLLLALFALLFVLSSYFTWANNMLFKLNLNLHGLFSMVASTDKKFKRKIVIPEMKDESAKVLGEKKLLFIRHGESEWNNVFNKGMKVLFPRLFEALVKETKLLTTLDSVFYDSPLNKEGLIQANQLSSWLAKVDRKPSTKPAVLEAISYLTAAQEDTIIVSSPLRRAVATTVVCLRRRLKDKREQVRILSSLSEISSNVDTISLADEPGSLADMSSLTSYCAGQQPKYVVTPESFDSTENKGRKPVRGSGQDRLLEFCGWCFKRKETAIIAGGHSLYFRYFFRQFLPSQVSHALKESKIPNSGIVMLTLQKIKTRDGQTLYRIDPASITEVYGFGHD